jgi:hypothetical protein
VVGFKYAKPGEFGDAVETQPVAPGAQDAFINLEGLEEEDWI